MALVMDKLFKVYRLILDDKNHTDENANTNTLSKSVDNFYSQTTPISKYTYFI